MKGNKVEQISYKIVRNIYIYIYIYIYIDEYLNWEEHIKQVSAKVSKNIGAHWKLKPFLTCKLLLQVYNSLIFTHFSLCNLISYTASTKRLDKLFIVPKKADRIISKADFLAHTDPKLNKFDLLKITDIGNLQISIFIFKFLKHDLPENFDEYFSLNSDSHRYFTRQSSGLYVSFANTGMRQMSIKIRVTHVWNKVSLDITKPIPLPIFKRKLRLYLISLYII